MRKREPGESGGRGSMDRKSKLRRLQLWLEPLETRRLLAGINITVYADQDNSRQFDSVVDEVAPNRLVYLDLNVNGTHDNSEPVAITDDQGRAFFADLEPGDYAVGLIANSQTQIEPTVIAPQTRQISAEPSAHLIVDSLLQPKWSIDRLGFASRIGVAPLEPISLGGPILSRIPSGESEQSMIVERGDAGRQMVRFETVTGRITPVSLTEFPPDQQLEEIYSTNTGLFARLSTRNSQATVDHSQIARLLPNSLGGFRVVQLSQFDGLEISKLAIADSGEMLAYVLQGRRGSELTIVDLQGTQSAQHFDLIKSVADIQFSPDKATLSVGYDGGGVDIFQEAASGYESAATLAEASFPLANMSVGSRFITASSTTNEFVVWNTESWMPEGRFALPERLLAKDAHLAVDRFGDKALVSGPGGVYEANLSASSTSLVHVSESVEEIRFGVLPSRNNQLPSGSAPRITLIEDVNSQIDVSEFGVTDPDGDELWFTVSTPARHTRIEMGTNGNWIFVPDSNFSGTDSFVLSVHDGQDSTQVVVEVQVSPVNDLPQDLLVDIPGIAENASIGSQLGFVTVVDADRDAAYTVLSSDSRFAVQNGKFYFTSGRLDFESEPIIVLRLTAIDAVEPGYSIQRDLTLSVVDTNEPPTGIELSSASVAENSPGSVVGDLKVIDPDRIQNYIFTVSDPRFIVEGSTLRLRDDASLDFESQASVNITVSAREADGTLETTRSFDIQVINRDEAATSLTLTSSIIAEGVRGATIGTLAVNDPDGEHYEYSVSDDRFMVASGVLKLREDIWMSQLTDRQVPISITATSLTGATISSDFVLRVVGSGSPYQNTGNPADVNSDGQVTPADVLIIINYLNAHGSQAFPAGGNGANGEFPFPEHLPDVNGDGIISPLDALLIINYLNSLHGGMGEGEGEKSLAAEPLYETAAHSDLVAYGPMPQSDYDEDREARDLELELLLEQLSRSRY